MSDDFDREAEREKLRRQLEAEEEGRKATQQMSELLLKGATMTNKHCDQCGDPIFRYQGQEFCPTCQQTVSSGSAEAGEPGDDGAVAETTNEEATEREPQQEQSSEPAQRARQPSQPQPTVPGDLEEAHASLVRKLTTLAHQAESTDDVGRSRELLAAAKEAAEALSALQRTRR